MLSHSKMWVVHLGKAPTRSNVPMELRGCRSFTLLEDVQKLLHGLYGRHTGTGAPLWLRSWLGADRHKHKLSDAALDKLKEVVQQLEQWERSKACKDEGLQVITV